MRSFNTYLLLVAALAGTIGVTEAAACPTNINASSLTQSYYPPEAECKEYKIPVFVTSDNIVFNFTQWDDDYALEDFLSAVTTRAGADYPGITSGIVTENATYEIAASFCTPRMPWGKEKTVILATHGIGQARTHWNSPYIPEEYNFVQWAISQGYSVFFYDRLGCGDSQKISGFKNQVNIQASVLQELSTKLRTGNGEFTGGLVPEKIAVIGFSYGSYTTHAAIAAKPSIADAVILTGIGFNSTGVNANGLLRSFVPRVAALQNPIRFGALDTGYLTWVDKFAQINTYFKRPFYDASTAEFAESQKQAFAIGEFLTFPNPAMISAENFTGPALHITGETDYIVCDGYCPGIYDEPAKTIYKNAKLAQYLHPGSSHNINFHHNATGAYKVITDFLSASGL